MTLRLLRIRLRVTVSGFESPTESLAKSDSTSKSDSESRSLVEPEPNLPAQSQAGRSEPGSVTVLPCPAVTVSLPHWQDECHGGRRHGSAAACRLSLRLSRSLRVSRRRGSLSLSLSLNRPGRPASPWTRNHSRCERSKVELLEHSRTESPSPARRRPGLSLRLSPSRSETGVAASH